MSNVWSNRLMDGAPAGDQAFTAVVPAGVRWVLKDLSTFIGTAGGYVDCSINGRFFVILFGTIPSGAPGYSGQWSGFQVANAGETVEVICHSGANFVLSGYVLST